MCQVPSHRIRLLRRQLRGLVELEILINAETLGMHQRTIYNQHMSKGHPQKGRSRTQKTKMVQRGIRGPAIGPHPSSSPKINLHSIPPPHTPWYWPLSCCPAPAPSVGSLSPQPSTFAAEALPLFWKSFLARIPLVRTQSDLTPGLELVRKLAGPAVNGCK